MKTTLTIRSVARHYSLASDQILPSNLYFFILLKTFQIVIVIYNHTFCNQGANLGAKKLSTIRQNPTFHRVLS